MEKSREIEPEKVVEYAKGIFKRLIDDCDNVETQPLLLFEQHSLT